MFGKRAETLAEPPQPRSDDRAALKAQIEAYHARTAELEAELEALEPPADLYQIRKRFEDGTYSIWKWSKALVDSWVPLPIMHSTPPQVRDYRYVRSGHQELKAGLPSHKAAEGWLKAYLDPT